MKTAILVDEGYYRKVAMKAFVIKDSSRIKNNS